MKTTKYNFSSTNDGKIVLIKTVDRITDFCRVSDILDFVNELNNLRGEGNNAAIINPSWRISSDAAGLIVLEKYKPKTGRFVDSTWTPAKASDLPKFYFDHAYAFLDKGSNNE